jgi:hypothetical protein
MFTMITNKSSNSQLKYKCELCDYSCMKKNDYTKHNLTKKHIDNYNKLQNPLTEKKYTCNCGKEYLHRQGLYAHKKMCNNKLNYNINENTIDETVIPETVIAQDSSNNDIIQVLLKENSDFKNMLIDMMKSTTDLVKNNTDLQKQNQDIQKQMLEVCKNIQPSTINNNTDNSSKNFNLNVFLNEKCKDAMNLEDFANSIQLKLSDLIRVGEEGYVPGMSKVIIEWLAGLKVCQRPIHCSDEKREVIQVKIADKWEKEAITSEKLMNAVRIIEKKQFDMITTFRDTYPECMNSESHHNDMLIKLFQNLSNSREPEFIKVMKRVSKSVVINKEENS